LSQRFFSSLARAGLQREGGSNGFLGNFTQSWSLKHFEIKIKSNLLIKERECVIETNSAICGRLNVLPRIRTKVASPPPKMFLSPVKLKSVQDLTQGKRIVCAQASLLCAEARSRTRLPACSDFDGFYPKL
jgi:hypothetical protein